MDYIMTLLAASFKGPYIHAPTRRVLHQASLGRSMTLPGEPRCDPRIRLCVAIDATPRWKGGTRVAMETIDISVNGAAVLSPINLPLKTQVSVCIHIPAYAGQAPMDLGCEAVVVNVEELGHTRRQWRAGIYFLDMPAAEQLFLKRFVYTALEASSDSEGVAVA